MPGHRVASCAVPPGPCARPPAAREDRARGFPDASLQVRGGQSLSDFTRTVAAPDHLAAISVLLDWLERHTGLEALNAVAHRIDHGGPKYTGPVRISTGWGPLVFAGGIGENAPVVRRRACSGLEFMGIEMDESRNDAGAAIVSADISRVCARVIPTDEERVIAEAVCRVLGLAQQRAYMDSGSPGV